MSVHDGHRERLKKRFIENGLDSFEDHLVLELLLFYVIPRKDTNELAHRLLNHFGNLESIFEATAEELHSVEGIGGNATVLLKLIPAVCRRYKMAKCKNNMIINNSAAAGAYLMPFFMFEREEVVYAMCLDGKNSVICCNELSRGVVNSAQINARKIVELVLAKNASSVILAHNHISGIAIPSLEDEVTTRHIKTTLASMGIALTDHIVIAGEDFVSMADSHMI